MDRNMLAREEAQKDFCAIIHRLFELLAITIGMEPLPSLQVVGLYVWLERRGFHQIIKKIVSFPNFLIQDLAKEALKCLKCIYRNEFAFSLTESEISMMQALLDERITLLHFHRNRENTILELNTIIQDVYNIASLSEIVHKALKRKNHGDLANKSIIPFLRSASQQNVSRPVIPPIGTPVQPPRRQQRGQLQHVGRRRTLFVTFSKGYPVEEWELEAFFKQAFGDCVEQIEMQPITENNPQSLNAVVVLHHPSLVHMILNGSRKAKFIFNGKHIWMREFVDHPPKRSFHLRHLL